jgi:hypothetical protein
MNFTRLMPPNVDSEKESSHVDFNDVEKRFTSDEIIKEKPIREKISIAAITRVLKQFIESSSYAEFSVRMKILKSDIKSDIVENSTNRSQLIELRILNCHMHTEGADFLGGLRPHRDVDGKTRSSSSNSQTVHLFSRWLKKLFSC